MKISIGLFLLLTTNLSNGLPRRPTRERRSILFDYEFFDKLNPFKPKPVQHLIFLPYSHVPNKGPETSHFSVHKDIAKHPTVDLPEPSDSSVYHGNTLPEQYFKVANINNLPLESSAYNVPSVNYVQIPEEELRNSYTHYIAEENGGKSQFVLSVDEAPSEELTTEFSNTDESDIIATEGQTSVDEVTDVGDMYGSTLHSLRATDDLQAITPIDVVDTEVKKHDESIEDSIGEIKPTIDLRITVQVPSQLQDADIKEPSTKKDLEALKRVENSKETETETLSALSVDASVSKQNEQTDIPIKVEDSASIDDVDGEKITTREEIKHTKHIDVHTEVKETPSAISVESVDASVSKQNEQTDIPIKVEDSASIDDEDGETIATREEIKHTKNIDVHSEVKDIPIRKISLQKPEIETGKTENKSSIKDSKTVQSASIVQSEDKAHPTRDFKIKEALINNQLKGKQSPTEIITPVKPMVSEKSRDIDDLKAHFINQQRKDKIVDAETISITPAIGDVPREIDDKVIKENAKETEEKVLIGTESDDAKVNGEHVHPGVIKVPQTFDGASAAVIKDSTVGEVVKLPKQPSGEVSESTKVNGSIGLDSEHIIHKEIVEVIPSVTVDKSNSIQQEKKYDHRVIFKRPVQKDFIDSVLIKYQKQNSNSNVIKATVLNPDEKTVPLSQEDIIPIKKVVSSIQTEESAKNDLLKEVEIEKAEQQGNLKEEIPIKLVKKSSEKASVTDIDDKLSTIDNESVKSLSSSLETHDSDVSSPDEDADGIVVQEKVRDNIIQPLKESDGPVKSYSLVKDFVDEYQSKLKDHSLFITDELMRTHSEPDQKISVPTTGSEALPEPAFESKLKSTQNKVPSIAEQPSIPVYNFGHTLPGFYLPPHPKTKTDLTFQTGGTGEASQNVGVAVYPGILPRTYGLKSYRFNYNVDDEPSGTTFSRYENSDGEKTHGQYSVLLPDGRTQIVKFFDEGLGFNADVKYY